MYKTVSGAPLGTFKQLKKRGDRAIAEAREATRILKVLVTESADLRDQTWLLHNLGRPNKNRI